MILVSKVEESLSSPWDPPFYSDNIALLRHTCIAMGTHRLYKVRFQEGRWLQEESS